MKLAVVLTSLVLSSAGCAPRQPLVGTWVSESFKGIVVEDKFNADGTGQGTMKGTRMNLSYTFKWWLDGDKFHYKEVSTTDKGVTKVEPPDKPEWPLSRLKWISNDQFEFETVNYEPSSKSTYTRKK